MLAPEVTDKRVQNRLLHFEDCAEAIDQLFRAAMDEGQDKAFTEFINFARRFSNLSVYNTMLVMVQRPGAVAVGSRRQWHDIGRRVLPDAIPIVILHPFGPVRFVFELNDTDGRPVPAQAHNPLFAHGIVTEDLYARAKDAAKSFAVDVVETDQYGTNLAGTAAGLRVYPEIVIKERKAAFRVKINAKHELASRYATLAHELGHIYCGHLGGDAKGRWPNRRSVFNDEKTKEMEAEAVAWLVCQRNDVKTRSKDYLNHLISEGNIEAVSMYSVFDAANRVESRTMPKKG